MDDSITADFYFNKYSAHGNEIFILNCTTSIGKISITDWLPYLSALDINNGITSRNFRSKRVVELGKSQAVLELLILLESCTIKLRLFEVMILKNHNFTTQ